MAISSEVKTVDVKGSEIRVKLLHPVDINWDRALRSSGANFIVKGEKKDNNSYTFLLGDSLCTLNVYSAARNNHK